jgi:hypothetical protein
LSGLFSLFLVGDGLDGNELLFNINQFLLGLESFLLSFDNTLGGKFFLHLGFNLGDGLFNLGDELLDIGNLGIDDLASGREKINLLLGGNLGGKVFVLGLNLCLDGLSSFLDLFGHFVNFGLSDNGALG